MNIANLKLAFSVLARRKVFTAISLVGITLTLVVLMVATAILDNILRRGQAGVAARPHALRQPSSAAGSKDMSTPIPGYGFLEKTIRDLPGAERVAYFTQIADGGHLRRRAADRNAYEARRRRRTGKSSISISSKGRRSRAADEAADRPVAVITEDASRQSSSAARPGRRDRRSTSAGRRIASPASCSTRAHHAPLRVCRGVGAGGRGQRGDATSPLAAISTASFSRKARDDIPAMKREFNTRVARYTDRRSEDVQGDRAPGSTPRSRRIARRC